MKDDAHKETQPTVGGSNNIQDEDRGSGHLFGILGVSQCQHRLLWWNDRLECTAKPRCAPCHTKAQAPSDIDGPDDLQTPCFRTLTVHSRSIEDRYMAW